MIVERNAVYTAVQGLAVGDITNFISTPHMGQMSVVLDDSSNFLLIETFVIRRFQRLLLRCQVVPLESPAC